MIAIVDLNSIYVSFEKTFVVDLISKPVDLLCNKNGYMVSHTEEVKKLGIGMKVTYSHGTFLHPTRSLSQ
jgi:DNA polymerase V